MSTITSAAVAAPIPRTGRHSFNRIAAISGLVAIAFGIGLTFTGTQPGLGKSASEVARFFANDRGAHQAYVVISALLAIPIAVFFVGVHRTLAKADREHGSAFATIFFYGAAMMSATAGAAELLYAVAALRGRAGLAPDTVRLLNDGSQIAHAVLGAWVAVTLGSVALATFRNRIRAGWYGWFCAVAALFATVAVIEAVNTGTGGVLTQLAFFGFALWTLVTSVLMLRDVER